MNSIRLAFLFLTLALIQGIQSYCVYNSMSDESSFLIRQTNSKIFSTSRFKKLVGKNGKECCPYTNWSCSIRPVINDEIYFSVEFKFANGHKAYPFGVKCSSGGALTILGDQDHYWAECTYADGTKSSAKLFHERA